MAASYLQQHPDAQALLDYAAGAGLARVQCPWVLGPICWDEAHVKKAACWLSQQVRVLKKTKQINFWRGNE